MLTFEEKQRLVKIINTLAIPNNIKQHIIENLDNIDKNKLLDIIDKYTNRLKETNSNKGHRKNKLLQSQKAYDIYKDEARDQIDTDKLLDLI